MPYSGSYSAIATVLKQLNVEPETRCDISDWDAESTACSSKELPDYLKLYESEDLAPPERDVLACFILNSLNEFVERGDPHAEVARAFALPTSNSGNHK